MKALLWGGLAVALVTTASIAQQPSRAKAPWQWTLEERTDARRDPTLRAERVRTARRDRQSRPPADVIDGRLHPELFFPSELFDQLIYSSFVSLPQTYPRYVAQTSRDLFRNPAEWRRFEELTREYASVLAEEHQILDTRRSDARLGQVRSSKCAAKARALRAVRKEFGRDRFDALLYEVVAPPRTSTYLHEETIDESIETLKRNEASCQ